MTEPVGDAGVVRLEGFHAVKHALRFGAELVDVRTDDLARLDALAAELAPDVRERLVALARVGGGDFPPTGVVATARRPAGDVAAVLREPGPGFAVLLDRPRHLGNVGAAIRVAAAAGADAVAVTGDADPWHPQAVRGAAGLQFALPVGRIGALDDVARPLVALDPGGDPLDRTSVPAGAVLAFGSERRGLGDDVLARADARLALPMRAGVSSLNLATAVAAALYALRGSGRSGAGGGGERTSSRA